MPKEEGLPRPKVRFFIGVSHRLSSLATIVKNGTTASYFFGMKAASVYLDITGPGIELSHE